VTRDRGEGLAVLNTEMILCLSYCAGILDHLSSCNIFRKDITPFILLIPTVLFLCDGSEFICNYTTLVFGCISVTLFNVQNVYLDYHKREEFSLNLA
jgi:hypothetical protein